MPMSDVLFALSQFHPRWLAIATAPSVKCAKGAFASTASRDSPNTLSWRKNLLFRHFVARMRQHQRRGQRKWLQERPRENRLLPAEGYLPRVLRLPPELPPILPQNPLRAVHLLREWPNRYQMTTITTQKRTKITTQCWTQMVKKKTTWTWMPRTASLTNRL